VRFGILGSLVVWRDGSAVSIGAAKQRAVLALLLIRRGELVPTETLVDELWGERPPPTALKALRTYVSHLRKTLGEGVLETHPGGYSLRLEPDALDAERFEALLARARGLLAERRAREARELLDEALNLWRGPPLAEFRYEAFARDEIGRLQELRLVALDQHLEAKLALGEHAAAVPELEALVREHPLRESLRALLMLALYRSGRQADALAAYQDARTALVEELGLEPSERLQQLERSILTHDPALELEVQRPPSPAPAAPKRPLRSRRHAVVIGVLLTVAAAATVAAVISMSGSSFKPLARLAPNSIGIVDPGRNALVGEIRLPTRPAAVTVDDGALWVAMQDDQTLLRLDAGTHKVTRTIGLPEEPIAVVAAGHYVWVLCGQAETLVEVDGRRSTVIRELALKGKVTPPGFGSAALMGRATLMAAGANAVWLAARPGLVTRIDAVTGSLRHMGSGFASAVAVGEGAVWALLGPPDVRDAGTVVRINPQTRRVTERVPPPAVAGLRGMVYGTVVVKGGVWVVHAGGTSAWRVDPATATISAVVPVQGPSAIASGEGAIWTANNDGTVSRIDPAAATLAKTIPLGTYPRVAYPVALAAGAGAVWVAVH
jgi:DNA-binding SARP family transcriptional activator/DNA-binding beta-propeller fold protein YncE